MKTHDLDAFKMQLTEMKSSLEANIARLRDELESVTTESGVSDLEDLASLESENMHHNALIAQQQHELSEVLHALSKIENGNYGICEETGDVIPHDRLRAKPHTRYCVSDAEKLGL